MALLRIPRHLGILLIAMLCSWESLCAQEYSVAVHMPANLSGRITCHFYANDTVARRRNLTINQGEVNFGGKAPAPHLVEISHPNLPSPIGFFVENSNIDIEVNLDNPTASKITGSRINSQYRYALEQCDGDLGQLVKNNPADIFTPYAIYLRLNELDANSLQALLAQLTGEATKTYHYRQLSNRLATLMATTEGVRLPDFTFVDDTKKEIHFDSVRNDTTATILLFTAPYCKQGTDIAKQIRQQHPEVHLQVIDISRHPKNWDAPYLQFLAVDRIPFMILLDNHGLIHTRDLRRWEVDRRLAEINNQ